MIDETIIIWNIKSGPSRSIYQHFKPISAEIFSIDIFHETSRLFILYLIFNSSLNYAINLFMTVFGRLSIG